MKKFAGMLVVLISTAAFAQTQGDDIKALIKSAEQGNIDAQYSLGWIFGHTEGYLNGEGLSKDNVQAAS